MIKFFTTLILILVFFEGVNAQDANYWSSSYNPAGFLTPGAVIAFNRDSGVMFYNPALLAYSTKNTASFNGSIYQYSNIKIKNGAGTGLDLNSTAASIIPAMISATISIKGDHPFTIGYALTHNPVIAYQATQQKDGYVNALDDSYSPGNEYFLGQYKSQNVISETSGILSGGFKASDHFAIGLSAEAQLRKQNYDYDVSEKALYNEPNSFSIPPFANNEEQYLVSYYNVGMTFKAGFSYDEGPSHLGVTISSPLLNITGSGSLLSNDEVNDLIMPKEKDTVNLLANSRQQSLKATYKMPFNVALGYLYEIKKTQIYFAAQYFAQVDQYNIITPKAQSFIKGVDDDGLITADLLKFTDARKSILNFGIGVSTPLQTDVTGYLSLHTDYNYADNALYKDPDGYKSNTSDYNLYHCQMGVNIKKRKFNFRAGLLLSYGTTNKYMQTVNFDDPNEANYLNGDPGLTKATQFSAGLMLSYIHNL